MLFDVGRAETRLECNAQTNQTTPQASRAVTARLTGAMRMKKASVTY
ncbi:MAG: hypothetical protein MI923_13165 [Phycisphaerales bacterium]|nr:hypothetical protein [Phycisphaerales bacterium]